MKKLILSLMCAISFAAQAAPLNDYAGQAGIAVLQCTKDRLDAKIGDSINGTGNWTAFNNCLVEQPKLMKDLYQKASKQLAKNPKAQAALKEHLVKLIAAIKGVDVLPAGEYQIDYERRQAALQAAVDEAWARLEVEM